MREVLKENKFLIILWLLCILGLLIFCGHYSGILIDFGREVYYPERILQGEVLYKDLFNIYGPLSYQINAVLYRIFGIKLSTLYIAGSFCSLALVSGIYLVATKFLTKFLSFSIAVLTIAIGVTTTSIFNFHFPYSWAVLYGLIAFVYSLYFLINYSETNKTRYLYISSFLCGACITCKYDFLLYSLIVLFFVFKSKNWKAFLSFCSVPIISFGILFLQGLTVSDLVNTVEIIKNMAKSKTLKYFYTNSGIYFHPKALLKDLTLLLKFVVPFSGILFGVYKSKKALVIISSILFMALFQSNFTFGFLPLLVLILTVVFLIKKQINQKLLILELSTLCVSAKVLWVLLIQSYGTFYVSILLVAIFGLLFSKLPQKLAKPAGICMLILSCLFFFNNLRMYFLTNQRIQTPKGTVFTRKAESSKKLISYFEDKQGKALILPEGMMINFMTGMKSDGFYNSFLPLYIETFSEQKIIDYFTFNKPDYIVFSNLDMRDYYFRFICEDYAYDFCAFTQRNYTLDKIIDDDYRYMIYKNKY